MTGISGLYTNTYGARVARGETTGWKERMASEYRELKQRYKKLTETCEKCKNHTLSFDPKNIDLMYKQKAIMEEYIDCLEERAKVEGVEL